MGLGGASARREVRRGRRGPQEALGHPLRELAASTGAARLGRRPGGAAGVGGWGVEQVDTVDTLILDVMYFRYLVMFKQVKLWYTLFMDVVSKRAGVRLTTNFL